MHGEPGHNLPELHTGTPRHVDYEVPQVLPMTDQINWARSHLWAEVVTGISVMNGWPRQWTTLTIHQYLGKSYGKKLWWLITYNGGFSKCISVLKPVTNYALGSFPVTLTLAVKLPSKENIIIDSTLIK